MWWPGHPDNQLPHRHADFNRLALQVTGYHRHPPGDAWRNPLWDGDLLQTHASYSTQDLLDALFLAARGDRFRDGLICQLEPQLHVMLEEVVHRVQSEDPPQFEVMSFATIEDLEEAQLARCAALRRRPDLIRSTTLFHWWPKRIKKRQGIRRDEYDVRKRTDSTGRL